MHHSVKKNVFILVVVLVVPVVSFKNDKNCSLKCDNHLAFFSPYVEMCTCVCVVFFYFFRQFLVCFSIWFTKLSFGWSDSLIRISYFSLMLSLSSFYYLFPFQFICFAMSFLSVHSYFFNNVWHFIYVYYTFENVHLFFVFCYFLSIRHQALKIYAVIGW